MDALSKLKKCQVEIATLQAIAETNTRNMIEAEKDGAAKQVALDNLLKARDLLSQLVEANQSSVADKVNGILTHALRTILDNDSYKTSVKQEVKRRTPEVRLAISDSDFESSSIVKQRGGGVVAIASFILSVLIQTRANPSGSRTFVLDERFGHVPKAALPLVGELLADLAEKGDCQFILVTHNQELIDAGDTVYHLIRSGGVTNSRLIQ